jgi:hypothetical protein
MINKIPAKNKFRKNINIGSSCSYVEEDRGNVDSLAMYSVGIVGSKIK